jgi:hypothetical protein
VEKSLQVHPVDRFQLAAEFKNELLKAQSGRFNVNFNLDQGAPTQTKKSVKKRKDKLSSPGVITKEITKKNEKRKAGSPVKEKKQRIPRKRIDRGGCLALIALLSFILILGLAVFSLLNPVLAKNLFNFLF